MLSYSRRNFALMLGGMSLSHWVPASTLESSPISVQSGRSLPIAVQRFHERFMRRAIKVSAKNPAYPFGAVIVNTSTGEVLAEGVNTDSKNPTWHGEIDAINAYIDKHGNTGWSNVTLYSTGEPCAMCMAAIVWTGISRVVWASSIQAIRNAGIGQIDIPAVEVAERAREFYRPKALIGGVLTDQTDLIFRNRKK